MYQNLIREREDVELDMVLTPPPLLQSRQQRQKKGVIIPLDASPENLALTTMTRITSVDHGYCFAFDTLLLFHYYLKFLLYATWLTSTARADYERPKRRPDVSARITFTSNEFTHRQGDQYRARPKDHRDRQGDLEGSGRHLKTSIQFPSRLTLSHVTSTHRRERSGHRGVGC